MPDDLTDIIGDIGPFDPNAQTAQDIHIGQMAESFKQFDEMTGLPFSAQGMSIPIQAAGSLTSLATRPLDLFGSGMADDLNRQVDLVGAGAERQIENANLVGLFGDRVSSERLLRGVRVAGTSALTNLPFAGLGMGGIRAGAMSGAYNQKVTQARDAGLSELEAQGVAIASGVIEGGMMTVMHKLGMGGFDTGAKQAFFKDGMRKYAGAIATRLLNAGAQVTGEEIEELSIYAGNYMVDRLSGIRPEEADWDDIASEAADVAFSTFLSTGTGQAAQQTQGAVNQRKREAVARGMAKERLGQIRQDQNAAMQGSDDIRSYFEQLPEVAGAKIDQLTENDLPGLLDGAADLATAENMSRIRMSLGEMQRQDQIGAADDQVVMGGIQAGLDALRNAKVDTTDLRDAVATAPDANTALEAIRQSISTRKVRDVFERAFTRGQTDASIGQQSGVLDAQARLGELEAGLDKMGRNQTEGPATPETMNAADVSEAQRLARDGVNRANSMLDVAEANATTDEDRANIQEARNMVARIDPNDTPDTVRRNVERTINTIRGSVTPEGAEAAMAATEATAGPMDEDVVQERQRPTPEVKALSLEELRQRRDEAAAQGAPQDILDQLDAGITKAQEATNQARQEQSTLDEADAAQIDEQVADTARDLREGRVPEAALVPTDASPEEVIAAVERAVTAFDKALEGTGAKVVNKGGYIQITLPGKRNIAVLIASEQESLKSASARRNARSSWASLMAHMATQLPGATSDTVMRALNDKLKLKADPGQELKTWLGMTDAQRATKLRSNGVQTPAWTMATTDSGRLPIDADALVYLTSSAAIDTGNDVFDAAMEEINHILFQRALTDSEINAIYDGLRKEDRIGEIAEGKRRNNGDLVEAAYQRYKEWLANRDAVPAEKTRGIFRRILDFFRGANNLANKAKDDPVLSAMNTSFAAIMEDAPGRQFEQVQGTIDPVLEARTTRERRALNAELSEFRRRQRPQTPEEVMGREEVLARQQEGRRQGQEASRADRVAQQEGRAEAAAYEQLDRARAQEIKAEVTAYEALARKAQQEGRAEQVAYDALAREAERLDRTLTAEERDEVIARQQLSNERGRQVALESIAEITARMEQAREQERDLAREERDEIRAYEELEQERLRATEAGETADVTTLKAENARRRQPLEQRIADLRQENLDLRQEMNMAEDEQEVARIASNIAANAREIEQLRIDIENIRIPERPVGPEQQQRRAARRATDLVNDMLPPGQQVDDANMMMKFIDPGDLDPKAELQGRNPSNLAIQAVTDTGRVMLKRIRSEMADKPTSMSKAMSERLGQEMRQGRSDQQILDDLSRQVEEGVEKLKTAGRIGELSTAYDPDNYTPPIPIEIGEQEMLAQIISSTTAQIAKLTSQRNQAKNQAIRDSIASDMKPLYRKLGTAARLNIMVGTQAAQILASRRDLLQTPEDRRELFDRRYGELTIKQLDKVRKLQARGQFAEAQELTVKLTKANMDRVDKYFGNRVQRGVGGSVISSAADITLDDMDDPDTFFQLISAVEIAKQGKRGGKLLTGLYTQNLLSPGTIAIGVGGNFLNLIKEGALSNFTAAGYDLARFLTNSKIEDAPTLRAVGPAFSAMMTSMPNAIVYAWRSFLSGVSHTKLDLLGYSGRLKEAEAQARYGNTQGIRGFIKNYLFRPIGAVDELFYHVAAQAAIATEATKKAYLQEGLTGEAAGRRVTELIEMAGDPKNESADAMELKRRALAYATETTFKLDDENGDIDGDSLDKLFNGIQRLRTWTAFDIDPDTPIFGKIAPLINGLQPGMLILPFYTTIVKIIGTGLNMTPIGSMTAVREFSKAGKQTDAVKAGIHRTRGHRMIGQSIVGSIMLAVAALMGDEEEFYLTGSVDPREKGKRRMLEAQNKVQTLRTFAGDVNYRRLDPVATGLTLVADARDAFLATGAEADKSWADRKASLLQKMWVNMFDKNFAQGIRNWIDTPRRGESNPQMFLDSLQRGAIPASGTIRWARRFADPTIRVPTSFVDETMGGGAELVGPLSGDPIQGRAPGALSAVITNFGATVRAEPKEHVAKAANWIEKTNANIAEDGGNTWRPAPIGSRFKFGSTNYELDGDDYFELRQIAAEEFEGVLKTMRFDKDGGTENQLDNLRKRYNKAKARARRRYISRQRTP